MRKWISFAALVAVAAVGCSEEPTAPTSEGIALDSATTQAHGEHSQHGHHSNDKFVIANRGSGTISVIDADDYEVIGTYELPAGEGDATPEPMYVVYNRNRVFVGDRANDRVVAFDPRSFEVEGMAPAGDGIFHMWANTTGKQLWVNNDIDKTTTVIDTRDLSVIATVDTPADLVAMGGKPHDVIVGPHNRFAYVSVLTPGDNDYVVQYDAHSFEEVGRAAVGKDPHLSLSRQHNRLYVPCQESNVVIVLNRYNLAEMTRIDVPGAHGAVMAPNGKHFYTTNLTGGGEDAIFTIDTRRNRTVGDATDSPYAVPHNLALDRNGRTLALTHSGGTADKVTIYSVGGGGRHVGYEAEVTVGLNPFGLAYVPR
ncbi:MAG: YncE family protein [Candidatus Eisenbacteria bacterium]